MDVKLEIDFRARFYQAARAFRKYITFLTDGIFIQEDTLFAYGEGAVCRVEFAAIDASIDRKSTRLNSSHLGISYAVLCLKKKTNLHPGPRVDPADRSRTIRRRLL